MQTTEPFAAFFNVANEPAYRGNRLKVETFKEEWQLARQRVLWALLLTNFALIGGVTSLLAGHFWLAVWLVAPLATALLWLLAFSYHKYQQYFWEQAALVGECQEFKAVVLALRLNFLAGRWFVAIALRGGQLFWQVYDVDDGQMLRRRLAHFYLAKRECYPELLWAEASTEAKAHALWLELLEMLPTLGFAPTKGLNALAEALEYWEFSEQVFRGPE